MIIGVKISSIGISCMLYTNRNETGNKAKIKWWNPNLENNKITLFDSYLYVIKKLDFHFKIHVWMWSIIN